MIDKEADPFATTPADVPTPPPTPEIDRVGAPQSVETTFGTGGLPSGATAEGLASLIRGQKALNGAVGCYFLLILTSLLSGFVPELLAGLALSLLVIGILTLGLFGIVAITLALSRSTGVGILWSILGLFLLIIPIIGLLYLVVLNSRASARLRDAGYRIGWLGAKT